MREELHQTPGTPYYIPANKLEDLKELMKVGVSAPPLDAELEAQRYAQIQAQSVLNNQQYYNAQPITSIQPSTDKKSSNITTLILTSLSILSSVLLIVFSIVDIARSSRTVADSAFDQCVRGSGQVSFTESLLQKCVINSQVYFQNTSVSEYLAHLRSYEKTQAESGIIAYTTPELEKLDKQVVIEQEGKKALPIASFRVPVQDAATALYVNNIFLISDRSFQNELFVQKVLDFLNKTPEYTQNEPLGNESVVLTAFTTTGKVIQSNTLKEIPSIVINEFEKTRVLLGVDGVGIRKRTIVLRAFGLIRDNVIMIQVNLPNSEQKSNEESIMKNCTGAKNEQDTQNCYQEAIKNNLSLQDRMIRLARDVIAKYGYTLAN